MPKVEITDSKGLVQKTGTGFESSKMPKSLLEMGSSVTKLTFAAVNAGGGTDYTGSKYFVLNGKSKKYMVYFSGIGAADNQAAPAKISEAHILVKVGELANDADATAVGAAVVTAIGAGSGNGLAEFTALNNAGVVTIASVNCQKSVEADSQGTLTALEVTAFSVVDRGAGDDTAGVALRPGCVNLLKSPEFGAGNVINNDGTGGADNAKFTLGDGDYAGQEVTIVRATGAATSGVHIVVLSHMRNMDGGAIVNDEEITFEVGAHADGSPLLKCVWDGLAWLSIGPAQAEMGFSGAS